MSDGEPSSIKRLARCAARAPALSRGYEDRVEARFDFAVYGTRFAAHQFFDRLSIIMFGDFWSPCLRKKLFGLNFKCSFDSCLFSNQ